MIISIILACIPDEMAKASTMRQIDCEYTNNIKPVLDNPNGVIYHNGKYIVADTYNHRLISVEEGGKEELCAERKLDSFDKAAAAVQSLRGVFGPKEDKAKTESSKKSMLPHSIVPLSDKEQHFLFTDMENGCILQLKNKKHSTWAEKKHGDVVMGRLTGIAINRKKEVFVADQSNKCVYIFDKSSSFQRKIPTKLYYPHFLAFDSKDQLYVADDVGGIKIFDTSFKLVKELFVNLQASRWACVGIAIDKFDNVFVTARQDVALGMGVKCTVTAFDRSFEPVVKDVICDVRSARNLSGLCFDYDRNRVIVTDSGWNRLKVYRLYKKA